VNASSPPPPHQMNPYCLHRQHTRPGKRGLVFEPSDLHSWAMVLHEANQDLIEKHRWPGNSITPVRQTRLPSQKLRRLFRRKRFCEVEPLPEVAAHLLQLYSLLLALYPLGYDFHP